MAPPHAIYIENGKTWSFAVSLEWPGWCRRGKGEEAAVEALLAAATRYRKIAGRAFTAAEVRIVERVPGNATTDFGAPTATTKFDRKPLATKDLQRQLAVLDRCWNALDTTVAEAPASLRKGPRGGGRDRDAVASHVREAERAYAAKVGTRVPPHTEWNEQRALIRGGFARADGGSAWPAAYAIRRIAWHVVDHIWEIEDRSE